MAAAVVIQNSAGAGQRPDAAVALQYWVLWSPAPATASTTVVAMCSTQAEANAVAALHPA